MNSRIKTSPLCVALIVAAGRGSRFGTDIPKQYIKVNHLAPLTRSVRTFLSHPLIDYVRVVIHPDDQVLYKQATGGFKILDPVFGGKERQDSVFLGLKSLKEINPTYVLIHDAARPFVSKNIISSLINSLGEGSLAVIPGISINDSLKRGENNFVIDSVNRKNLWQAQTPQAFDYNTILDAHLASAGDSFNDDAEIATFNDINIKIIEGSSDNFKITTHSDLIKGENVLIQNESLQEQRVGTGFDVHSLEPGDSIKLCGIKIPFDKSLKGHSDADVGLHAITDAILGATGLGDIGLFFPSTDPQWRNADSKIFLNQANSEIISRGGKIINIDLTVICEKPKISDYRDQMRDYIATVLDISSERINIKATTTENLGFIGRGEGIAAHAIVAVRI